MTEEKYDFRILVDESMDVLKSRLAANPYTDKQLHQVASFMVAPILTLGRMMGVSDDSPQAIFATANVLARTTLADFINKGLISVTAIDRFMREAEAVFEAEQARLAAEDSTDDSSVGQQQGLLSG